MKKTITCAIILLLAVKVSGQTPIVQYNLPLDLAGNQAVDPVPDLAEIKSTASYIDLTSLITKLQGDLGAQTDNLNTNKNLQQIYTPLGVSIDNASNYPDDQKRATLKTAYETAMKIVKSNIDNSKKNISRINSNIDKITRMINDRMNIEQSQQTFRQWVSAIFAILIAIIILSFFFILFKSNSKDLASMLMGESGLQFITLFSLIISIILFGVLNILEGKELAAIISAIAGFILGKYNPSKNNIPVNGSGAGGGQAGGGQEAGGPGADQGAANAVGGV